MERERVSRRASDVRMWATQWRSWEGDGVRLLLDASLGRPVWSFQARGGRLGWGGAVKMGRGDWALPKIERWAGRMCRRACLGTLMPLLVSNEPRCIMISRVWRDRM